LILFFIWLLLDLIELHVSGEWTHTFNIKWLLPMVLQLRRSS